MTTQMDELTMDQRLARLEAVQQITALKHRYLRACDNKDPEGFRAAFIRHGATIDFGPMGSFPDADGIAAVYEQVALHKNDGAHTILDMHHAVHPDIQILDAHGDEAERYVLCTLIDELHRTDTAATLVIDDWHRVTSTETVAAMEYWDRYVIEDGEWRISHSRSMPLWSLTRPLGEVMALADNMPITITAP